MARRKRKRQPKKNTGGDKQQPAKSNPAPTPAPVDVADANPVNAEAGNTGANQQNQQQPRRSRWNDRRLNTLFAGAVALFALAQVIVGYWQWGEMQAGTSQTQQTLDTMQLEQRPWLIGVTPRFREPLAVDENMDFEVPFLNTGRSPAIIKSVGMGIYVLPTDADLSEPLKQAWLSGRKEPRDSATGPGSRYTAVPNREHKFTKPVAKAVEAEIVEIYLVGTCTYTGPGGGDYAAECCFRYDWKRQEFLVHRKHNRIEVPPNERGGK